MQSMAPAPWGTWEPGKVHTVGGVTRTMTCLAIELSEVPEKRDGASLSEGRGPSWNPEAPGRVLPGRGLMRLTQAPPL